MFSQQTIQLNRKGWKGCCYQYHPLQHSSQVVWLLLSFSSIWQCCHPTNIPGLSILLEPYSFITMIQQKLPHLKWSRSPPFPGEPISCSCQWSTVDLSFLQHMLEFIELILLATSISNFWRFSSAWQCIERLLVHYAVFFFIESYQETGEWLCFTNLTSQSSRVGLLSWCYLKRYPRHGRNCEPPSWGLRVEG